MVHEHHYTLFQVLDLPICTVRQQVELIQQRRKAESHLSVKVAEWQTKVTLAGLAALAMSEEAGKELSKFADKVELKFDDDEDGSSVPSPKNDTRTIEEIMEQGALVDLDRVPQFEKMQGRLGSLVSKS